MKKIVVFAGLSLFIAGVLLAKGLSESPVSPQPQEIISLETAFEYSFLRAETDMASFNCSWTELRCD